jgi:hypothetical protein
MKPKSCSLSSFFRATHVSSRRFQRLQRQLRGPRNTMHSRPHGCSKSCRDKIGLQSIATQLLVVCIIYLGSILNLWFKDQTGLVHTNQV